MKERPILFSAPMVRAILEGRKTQTRRVILPQPQPVSNSYGFIEESAKYPGEWFQWYCGEPGPRFTCRYGVPGDRLWVEESWGIGDHGRLIESCLNYRAGGQKPLIGHASPDTWSIAGNRREINNADLLKVPDGWRNAMFMPRWASRLLLQIESIEGERVQDIGKESAIAEGLATVTKDGSLWKYGVPDLDGLPGTDDHGWPWAEWCVDPRDAYRKLWDSINEKRGFGWDFNPYVWAVTFSEVTA